MRQLAILFLITVACAVAGRESATGGLFVRVDPEARLTPSSVQLAFHVAGAGEVVEGESVNLTAWIRALPGQRIHVDALPGRLTGPAGAVPTSALQWRGSMVRASGGAEGALCRDGAFDTGPSQPLIEGWNRSGTATCSLTFYLATQTGWPTGEYSGRVLLSLTAE